MRNQAFLLAACAAVVIGCGGGGGKHRSSSSTPGNTTTTGGMTVDLGDATYGRVEVSYLTGAGRDEGDLYLEIVRQRIQNSDGIDVFNRTDGSTPINLRLPGFQTLSTGIDIPFGSLYGRSDSQLETQLIFDPSRLLVEQADGTLQDAGVLPSSTNLPDNPEFTLPAALDARIRAFPGRNALVQLRVSPAVFNNEDSGLGIYTFNRALFQRLNNSVTGTDPTATGTIASRLSDFVRFDLRDVALEERPNVALSEDYSGDTVPNGGRFVYFSGDNTAISSANGENGNVFQEIGSDFTAIVLGRFAERTSGAFQGTYDLSDLNPVDVNGDGNLTRLVAQYGSFRDFNEVLTGGGSFEMVMFPNSGEQYNDERQGDLVAFHRNAAGNVDHMYFGGVSLEPGAGQTTGTFQLNPIFYLGTDPAAAPESVELTGTVSGYVNSSGAATTNFAAVRKFKFAFNTNANFAAAQGNGLTPTGTVTVFRK